MEVSISRKNIDHLCRVCLTQSKNLTHLTNGLEILNDDSLKTVHGLLEYVTHKRIVSHSDFPSNICQVCLSMLKLSYEFVMQFNKSQMVLEDWCERSPLIDDFGEQNRIEVIVEKNQAKDVKKEVEEKATVELIFGENKVDLKNVLVVENEETDESFSYEGFLNNLGYEVSATFINDKLNPATTDSKTQDSVVIEKIPTNTESNILLDLSDGTTCLSSEILDNERTTVKTLYLCDICNLVFNSESEYEEHLKTCQYFRKPEDQIVCEKCGHASSNQQQAYRHKQKHKGRLHKCTQCSKSYFTPTHLKVHMRVHENIRPYLCSICAKSFNYANALEYHMRLHTGEKKYVCNYCGLAYTMPQTLKRHLRTHTKEKPYLCMYCGKRFCSRGEKLCHEQVHTGEKSYFCEYCGKGFIKTANRALHYLSHAGNHQCYVCSKGFIDHKVLSLHLKRAHKMVNMSEYVEIF